MADNEKVKKVCYVCGGNGVVYAYPDPGLDRSYRRDRKHVERCWVCGGCGNIEVEQEREQHGRDNA